MDPNKDIEDLQAASYAGNDEDDASSVDDFIRQLEAKEKDLHITADTSIIEIAESFDDGELPDGLRDVIERASHSLDEPVKPAAPAADPLVKRLEGEVVSLRSAIAKMEADRDEMFQNSQRRAKDFESFRARSERERQETFQNQVGNLATLMLPALDNLNRALDAAEDLGSERSPAFQQFYEGIALVNEQISDILVKMGIKPIRTLGLEFDPHYHEAVATEETNDHPPNTICDELLRGYIAGDRVIRHSMVKVAVPLAELETETTVETPSDPEVPAVPNHD